MVMKKTPRRKKRERAREIDYIPKCWQQPRSPVGPKRRTDFSLFFCFSSSTLCNGRLGKGFGESRDNKKEILELPLAQCSNSLDKRHGVFSNVTEIPVVEVESVAQNASFEAWRGRTIDNGNSDIIRKLEFNPDKSQITESSDINITPGSVVWAKTTCQLWWPAEILGERSTVIDSKDQGIDDGHVLIQYYGNHESAWVDPARDLSEFGDCFEERSCNPVEEFQDALKQALHQRECQSLSKQFSGSSDYTNCSNQQEQLLDKSNSSSSSRTESACQERRRGKRERKPKVYFDDVTLPLNSARKVRRFRIMRFLGLAAPVGSPFSPASM